MLEQPPLRGGLDELALLDLDLARDDGGVQLLEQLARQVGAYSRLSPASRTPRLRLETPSHWPPPSSMPRLFDTNWSDVIFAASGMRGECASTLSMMSE